MMRDRTNRIGNLQADRELREKLPRPARSVVVGTDAPCQPSFGQRTMSGERRCDDGSHTARVGDDAGAGPSLHL